jgi:hypothetical protein
MYTCSSFLVKRDDQPVISPRRSLLNLFYDIDNFIVGLRLMNINLKEGSATISACELDSALMVLCVTVKLSYKA